MRLGKDKSGELELRSNELLYRYGPRDRRVYYWQLPYPFLGNKIAAYGGNMTIVQKYSASGSDLIQDSDIIIMGNGIGKR